MVGVEVAGGAHPALCRVCLFNGDPQALRQGLLGPVTPSPLPLSPLPLSPSGKPGLSAWVWALAARANGVDLGHHNVFFTADPADEWGPMARGTLPERPTLYVCAQVRGGVAPVTGPERFDIIMNGPAHLTGLPNEGTTCRQTILSHLGSHGLIPTSEPGGALLSPSRLAQLYPGSGGAIYGGSPEGALAAFRRPTARTALPDLDLAGGGAHPGAGVPMARLSGRHAAEAIWQDRILPSGFRPAAMAGGRSTASAPTEPAPYR